MGSCCAEGARIMLFELPVEPAELEGLLCEVLGLV